MPLTASFIRDAKGRDKAYKVSDGGGLYMFVQPSGQRYWRLAYRWAGNQRTLALGVYPAVGLMDARKRRDAVRKLLAQGTDPLALAREKAAAVRLAEMATFKAVAEEFVAKWEREGRAEVTIIKQRSMLRFAYPKLGPRPINQITPHDVYDVLRKIEGRGHYETARRLRGLCSQVFRYGVATGRADRDVCVDLRGAITTPKVKHLAALTNPKEVGDLLVAIDGFSGYRVTHAALRLAPHVFTRPGELRQAEWAEVDLEARVWTISAEKMKMRRPLSVPLSDRAIAIPQDVAPVTAGARYVFPCQGKRDRPMYENTLNLALQRLGFGGGRMTAHGFRAMASMLLNESSNWNADAIERQLGHQDANAVRRVYARGEYWDERVRMMQAWSDQIDAMREEASRRRETALAA